MKIPENICLFLNNYFDKIFVITLDRASERQQKIRELLDGVSYEFFFGADKLHLDIATLIKDGLYDEDKAKQMDRYGKRMPLGHIACSLSHKNIYQHILEKNYKKVLIFEDDIIPQYESLHDLVAAIAELPSNWELVYLGYNKHEIVTPKLRRKQFFYLLKSRMGFMKWSPVMIKNLLPKPFSNHLRTAGFHDCTHAYAISASGASKLAQNQTPIAFNADDLLSHTVMKGELNAYITHPKFFDQEQFTNPQQHSYIHH